MAQEAATGRMRVDAAALKALAHPLRVRLYDLLADEGPATASQLAARLGESSGTTSYHLRQLAKHGFIIEDEERGNRRDRWWRSRPGGISLEGWRYLGDPETADDMQLVKGEILRSYTVALERWFAGLTDWEEQWLQASEDSSWRFFGTPEELAAVRDDVGEVLRAHRARIEQREPPPGSARIMVQFHAFPSGRLDDDEA